MAVRDRNQFVWQAYVIASSIVSLLLLGGLFFMWRSYTDKAAQLEAQGETLKKAQQDFTTANGQADRLLSMMGVGQWSEADLTAMAEQFKDDPKMQLVEQEFAKAQSLFPANTPLGERNLIKLPQMLLETVRKRNEDLSELRHQTDALKKELETAVAEHRQARDEAELEMKKAQTALAEAREEFKNQLAKFNQDVDSKLKGHDENLAKVRASLAQAESDKTKLIGEKENMQKTITDQAKNLQEFRSPDFATPQATVIDVRDGGTLVWIDIGKANGLTKGVPFSILDASDPHTTKAVPKANMVIEHVSDNMARGRVFFDEADASARRRYYANMAKPGDQVYSPAWRPGREVGFALLGEMGNYDYETIRQLIHSAGGVVHAELPAKGTPTSGLPGISPNTSYLVIGTDVSSLAERPASEQRASDYAKFIASARENGVMQISVDKLLGLLKVDQSTRVVPLGDRARASDFQIRSPASPPHSRGSVSEIYSPSDRPKP